DSELLGAHANPDSRRRHRPHRGDSELRRQSARNRRPDPDGMAQTDHRTLRCAHAGDLVLPHSGYRGVRVPRPGKIRSERGSIMKKWLCLTALASSALTLLVVRAAAPAQSRELENAKVQVTEVTYAPGEPRPRGVREHDQVIVFMDDCRYERLDPQTGQKT